MDTFIFDLIKIFLQALFFLAVILISIWFYFRIRQQRAGEASSGQAETGIKNEVITTLKLQACERLVLFLERITLNSLILRVHTSDMKMAQAQSTMIRTVREEFEYNQSQQLYVSTQTWEKIRHAKEETIRMINTAASNLNEESTSHDLARVVIQLVLNAKTSPIANAIEAIKDEIR